jgi:hypothetical protein
LLAIDLAPLAVVIARFTSQLAPTAFPNNINVGVVTAFFTAKAAMNVV